MEFYQVPNFIFHDNMPIKYITDDYNQFSQKNNNKSNIIFLELFEVNNTPTKPLKIHENMAVKYKFLVNMLILIVNLY